MLRARRGRLEVLVGMALIAACASCGSSYDKPPAPPPAPRTPNHPELPPKMAEKKAETTVPWTEAESLILSGEVVGVAQEHSLTVHLHLKDGRALRTVEPKIDEIWRLLERCGDRCAGASRVTE